MISTTTKENNVCRKPLYRGGRRSSQLIMKYNRLIFHYYNFNIPKPAYGKLTSRNWERHERQNRLTFASLFVFYACYCPFLDHVIINLAGYNCSNQCIWYFSEKYFKCSGGWVVLKFIPRTSDFADFFSGPRSPRGPRNSPGLIYTDIWAVGLNDLRYETLAGKIDKVKDYLE